MIEAVADKILILVSSTLIVCYLGGLFYSKTKIPDILWVLGLGILLGPVLGFLDKELFLSISPLMSTVALAIILFDAGINVDIKQLVETLFKSTVLSSVTILIVIISVGYFLNFLMPQSFTLLQGMLLGAMIGGTSTVAVFGVMSGLDRLIPNIEGTRTLLMIESVISDPICIVSSITIIKMIMLPGVSIEDSLKDILYIFFISSIFGLAIGMIWAEVLDKISGKSLNYMMTIAILFPVFIITERMIGEGGGPMAALTFGLIITNYRYFTERMGVNRKVKIDKRKLREFHEEITFFIKSFFFVYIGLIVTISLQYISVGMIVLALIFFIRNIVVTIISPLLKFSKQEKLLSRIVYASGLPAFVMSQLPVIFDPQREIFLNPEIYPNLTMPIVLGTVLIAAIAGPIIAKNQLT